MLLIKFWQKNQIFLFRITLNFISELRILFWWLFYWSNLFIFCWLTCMNCCPKRNYFIYVIYAKDLKELHHKFQTVNVIFKIFWGVNGDDVEFIDLKCKKRPENRLYLQIRMNIYPRRRPVIAFLPLEHFHVKFHSQRFFLFDQLTNQQDFTADKKFFIPRTSNIKFMFFAFYVISLYL